MTVSSYRSRRPSLAKGQRDLSSVQPDLFQRLEQPASLAALSDLDIHFELLGAINTVIRQARGQGITRERIVDEMNRLLPELDKPITVRQLNGWTAASKEYSEFPARYLPAFCAAVDCDLPLRVLAQAITRELVDAREFVAKQLGETQIEAARLRRQARALEQQLGG